MKNKNKGNGNIGLNSSYKRVKPDDSDYIYIPIIGTNNIQGNFYQKIKDDPIYKTGGIEYLSRYINILRDEFGKNRVLYFDAGEYYNKSIKEESNKIEEFFNYIDLKATILNETENQEYLEKIYNRSYSLLSSKTENYKLYKTKLINGDIITIGIIGLTIEKNENYNLTELIIKLELFSNNLKNNGVDAIILLTNLDIQCVGKELKLNMFHNDKQFCDVHYKSNRIIFDILNNSGNILDAVIASNSNNFEMHHWENNIPIMSSPSNGKYFNIMYLPFKKKDNKYILYNNEIKIEGPIPICEKIFNDTQICDDEIPSKTKNLINYSWHDRKITKDKNFNF